MRTNNALAVGLVHVGRLWAFTLVWAAVLLSSSWAQTPTSDTDSDKDGMPDTWETANGLDPNDPRDAALDMNLNGRTNLRCYEYNLDPGPDLVGYKKRGIMKPLYYWNDDEVISLLDDVSASDYFFHVVNTAYGRHRGDYGEKAIAKLKDVYASVLTNNSATAMSPAGLPAAIRWLHDINPEQYPVTPFLNHADGRISSTAQVASRDGFISDTLFGVVKADLADSKPDRQIRILKGLAKARNPEVQAYLRSPECKAVVTDEHVRAVLADLIHDGSSRTGNVSVLSNPSDVRPETAPQAIPDTETNRTQALVKPESASVGHKVGKPIAADCPRRAIPVWRIAAGALVVGLLVAMLVLRGRRR